MIVNGSGRNEQWGPSIEASYQVSVHFGWGVLEAYLSVIQFIANCILLISISKLELSPFPQNFFFFIKHTIINMNFLWRPCLLMDRDEIRQSLLRTFHRCFLPSFSSFVPVVSEEKIFKNRSIRNKNCLWRPCLLMDRDEISNLYWGPSIDASYQVSVHLAQWFQRRRF